MTAKYGFDIFLLTAYGLFLLGASGVFRYPASGVSVKMVQAAVFLDICARLLYAGDFLGFGFAGGKQHIDLTLFFGGFSVWLACFAAFYCRSRKIMPPFYALITVMEIFWFALLVVYIYQKYRVSAF